MLKAAPPQPSFVHDDPVMIGPQAVLLGCLDTVGTVIVRGEVDGEIRADKVVVMREGLISGTIVAGEVDLEGQAVDALIFADRILLCRGCLVTGEMWHRDLQMEAGHVFEGKSRRHEDPRSLAPVSPEFADHDADA